MVLDLPEERFSTGAVMMALTGGLLAGVALGFLIFPSVGACAVTETEAVTQPGAVSGAPAHRTLSRSTCVKWRGDE